MGTTETKKMRVGVVGCGAISDIYLTNMIHNFENLEVAACCAGHLEHAKKKAEQYGIKGCTYEEILADPSIEMVVILTPAPTHEGLIRQALEAGKHVYTEKTMTLAPETAAKLIELAEEKHLYLGSAPDTFLGSALQTARKAIDDGLIGEVTSFEACANRDLDLLASIFRFLRMPGGGICYDFGVYYLTAIVSLFGPVDRVVSSVRNLAPKRVNVVPDSPEYGQEFDYSNESQGRMKTKYISSLTVISRMLTALFSKCLPLGQNRLKKTEAARFPKSNTMSGAILIPKKIPRSIGRKFRHRNSAMPL